MESDNQIDQDNRKTTYFNRFLGRIDKRPDSDFEFKYVDSNPYEISYACLLIPRFHNHLLVGDITAYLTNWMQKICISFAWKLEMIDIQPAYFHWGMSVSMTNSPAQFIRNIRKSTSSQIFEEFPRYRKDNQSDDFWAPANLILAGKQPHPAPMIEEFINIARSQQGFTFWKR